jgi:hypothetical protein
VVVDLVASAAEATKLEVLAALVVLAQLELAVVAVALVEVHNLVQAEVLVAQGLWDTMVHL